MALWIKGRARTLNKGNYLLGNIYFTTGLIKGLLWSPALVLTLHVNVFTGWCGCDYSLRWLINLPITAPATPGLSFKGKKSLFIGFPIMQSTFLLIAHWLRQFDLSFRFSFDPATWDKSCVWQDKVWTRCFGCRQVNRGQLADHPLRCAYVSVCYSDYPHDNSLNITGKQVLGKDYLHRMLMSAFSNGQTLSGHKCLHKQISYKSSIIYDKAFDVF